MVFRKPIVLQSDLGEVAGLFNPAKVIASRYLGGVPNVTWAVEFGPDVFAIRVCNHGYTSTEHLVAEVSLLSYLERAGYKYSPRLVRARSGGYIAHWRGYPVIATRLINGKSGQAVSVTASLCFEVGQALASLRVALEGCRVKLPPSERFDIRSRRLIDVLPLTTSALSWSIDISNIGVQFEDALDRIMSNPAGHFQRLVHTDVWPPNTIVEQGHLVGIVDFDDLAFGPPILDLASAFAEFAIDYRDDTVIEARGCKLLEGYRTIWGAIDEQEVSIVLPCIVYSYASWLACNALHQVPYEESEIYYRRLRRLRQSDSYARWDEVIRETFQNS